MWLELDRNCHEIYFNKAQIILKFKITAIFLIILINHLLE